jgi:hypothetical protein
VQERRIFWSVPKRFDHPVIDVSEYKDLIVKREGVVSEVKNDVPFTKMKDTDLGLLQLLFFDGEGHFSPIRHFLSGAQKEFSLPHRVQVQQDTRR